MRRAAFLLVCLSLFPFCGYARVISYAPVTNRVAVPAVQDRATRHYLLMEAAYGLPLYWGCQITCFPGERRGQFVLYDFSGAEPPRVLLPGNDPEPTMSIAALWEEENHKPRLLVKTDARVNGDNPDRLERLLYSSDAGESWRIITFAPGSYIPSGNFYEDVGGRFVRARGSQIRIGNAKMPFVFVVYNDDVKTSRVYGLQADGTPRTLADMLGNGEHSCCYAATLVGSDRTGSRFLVTGAPRGTAAPQSRLWSLDSGTSDLRNVAAVPRERIPLLDGWITPDRAVYLEDRGAWSRQMLSVIRDGTTTEIASAVFSASSAYDSMFAIPTHDYRGAWIIQKKEGGATVLSRHTINAALIEQWRDLAGPRVEALHADSVGEKLLVQVHRERPLADQRMFIDPALALWKIGDPAPRQYDELYLIEGPGKAFVHLDVDFVAQGGTFIFDGASSSEPPWDGGGQISGGGGGGEVVQEWGVVRSSLTQRLVLPGVARVAGMRGSLWRTDVVLRNPNDQDVSVSVRFVPNEVGEGIRHATLVLGAGEIRVIPDALHTLFGMEQGGGAFFLTPDLRFAINVTSRSYTQAGIGTFATAIPASEIFASAAPRFPVTFAGAFQGSEFRTNVLVTDTSPAGTGIQMRLGTQSELLTQSFSGLTVPPGSETQFNSVHGRLNVPATETGALVFQPTAGEAIASVVVIDNRTNDPSYYPPDLPAPYVRTIPLIAHIDGNDGSRMRSDLFLYNSSDDPSVIFLNARAWIGSEQETRVALTLAPNESRIIRDALPTLFGKTGMARLRYQSGIAGESVGIRVTSRTYFVREDGATYGQVIPPLNSFQSAAAGDTLEILGAFGGENFQIDLTLIELNSFPSASPVRVRIETLDHRGVVIDSFETEVAMAGGRQLTDMFRGRNLGNGPAAGWVIRVSPFGGMVGAFASVVDKRSGDPMYLGAVLAAR